MLKTSLTPVLDSLAAIERRDWALLAALVASVVAASLIRFYAEPFFIDFPIIFEGAYRLGFGQVPYRDFFLPTGPVTLYVQALFNAVFGPTLLSLGMHGAALAAILAGTFYLSTHGQASRTVRFILGFSCLLSLNGYNPWYNQEAYFFLTLNFILVVVRVDAAPPRWILPFSALLTLLSFFSKQDIGLMQFCTFAAYFLLWGVSWWRVLAWYVVPFVAASAALPLAWTNYGDFFHWFNLGQAPHQPQLHELFGRLRAYFATPRIFVAAFFAFCFLWPQIGSSTRRRCFLLVMLAVIPLVSDRTSGLHSRTMTQGVTLMVFLGYQLIPGSVLAMLPRTRPPLPVVALVLTLLYGIELERLWGFLINYRSSEFTRIESGAYRGALIRSADYRDLVRLKQLIQQHDGDFVAFCEYQFLYTDFGVEPPRGVPLWHHLGISFFERDAEPILEAALAKRPKLFVLQESHVHSRPTFNDWQKSYLVARGYRPVLVARGPIGRPIEVFARE